MASEKATRSAQIRQQLSHPIIDADGTMVEFMPLLRDYLREEAGAALAIEIERVSDWHHLPSEQRLERRIPCPGWWGLPTRMTSDHAASMLPRLFESRMDE